MRIHPQFGQAALRASLTEAGIAYLHLAGLGGRRHPRPDSPHTALRVAAATSAAYMCAETLWWRCHRRMLSDVLAARGWEVLHLAALGRREPHHLWDVARAVNGTLVYDGGAVPLPHERT